jgi:hypothetical protein
MLTIIIVILVLVVTFGLGAVVSGLLKIIDKGVDVHDSLTNTKEPIEPIEQIEPIDEYNVVPASEEIEQQVGGVVSLPEVGAPINSFVEFGEIASSYPKDVWLDNVALTIPPSNVGTTDIIFVDAFRPQQCYDRCKNSPFCRFFSYWKETGSCNLHQTLQNGETTPENMIRYAYTVPFSQHWVSGYVKKSGNSVPSYVLEK